MAKKIIIYFISYIVFMIVGMYSLDLLFKQLGRNVDKSELFHITICLANVNLAIIYSIRYSKTNTLISKCLVYFSRGLIVLYQVVMLLAIFYLISVKEFIIITIFVFLTFAVINFIFRKSKDEINK